MLTVGLYIRDHNLKSSHRILDAPWPHCAQRAEKIKAGDSVYNLALGQTLMYTRLRQGTCNSCCHGMLIKHGSKERLNMLYDLHMTFKRP